VRLVDELLVMQHLLRPFQLKELEDLGHPLPRMQNLEKNGLRGIYTFCRFVSPATTDRIASNFVVQRRETSSESFHCTCKQTLNRNRTQWIKRVEMDHKGSKKVSKWIKFGSIRSNWKLPEAQERSNTHLPTSKVSKS
jgi:hypothetical protein